ncbi:TPA: hypothetical protein N0F65_006982 [Lagenidium giganteum]|uniref:NAD(P)-binding domain-containing protein n=1 Tax=Lagenidium giganteum TaxID=4803 RepID=A0AAV2ZHA7_9STRA|nr:TPA: hypothetical protein N0F65_006982 [Lagenidium giganteum]
MRPSPSRSASSIISCISSSVSVSPSSVHTRLRLRNEILPVLSSSKSLKILVISSRESRPFYHHVVIIKQQSVSRIIITNHRQRVRTILLVIISMNSSISIVPDSSLSMSAIIWRISAFLTWNPSARMAALSSRTSIVPLPSVSNSSSSSSAFFTGLGFRRSAARDRANADADEHAPLVHPAVDERHWRHLRNSSRARKRIMTLTTAKVQRLSALRTSATKAYEKSKHRVLVIGGNGFVGTNILQRAVQKGIEVRSLNPSGKPQWQDIPWIDQVDWHQGDVFNADDLSKAVEGMTGVISTVGAFGSNEFMEKLCGDSTVAAARAAQKAGVERFVFISNSRVGSNIPSWAPLQGYYSGKERAEAAVRARFPQTGVSLRPGFIYGWRRVGSYTVPLQLFGAPMSLVARNLGAVSAVVSSIPFFGDEMFSAVPVSAVAKAAVLSAIGPVHGKTLDSTSILALSDSFHHTL